MKLTEKDRKLIEKLRRMQEQGGVNRSFGIIVSPIVIGFTIFCVFMFANGVRPGEPAGPFIGFMWLATSLVLIAMLVRWIVGNSQQTIITDLLLRALEEDDDGNSQQGLSPGPADQDQVK